MREFKERRKDVKESFRRELPRWRQWQRTHLPLQESKRHTFNPWVGKILWRRAWQLTPVFLSGEFYGQRSLPVYHPQRCKESDMTEVTQHNTQDDICSNRNKLQHPVKYIQLQFPYALVIPTRQYLQKFYFTKYSICPLGSQTLALQKCPPSILKVYEYVRLHGKEKLRVKTELSLLII